MNTKKTASTTKMETRGYITNKIRQNAGIEITTANREWDLFSRERDTDVAEAMGAVKAATRNRTCAATWAGMTEVCVTKEETTCMHMGGGTVTGQ